MANERELRALFGHCSFDFNLKLDMLEDNDPEMDSFRMEKEDAERLGESAWEQLGVLIAGNDHLRDLNLSGHGLDDAKMVSVFRGLTTSGSLNKMSVGYNAFGIGGAQSMAPFLRSSPNLTYLTLSGNTAINTECFDLLLGVLDGRRIEQLNLFGCSIESLEALGRCALQELRILDLSSNEITDIPTNALANYTHLERLDLNCNELGEGGFRAIANLLRNEACCLEHLDIEQTGMADADAVALADALKCNTKLYSLSVQRNEFGREGLVAFLKLLIDASSFGRAGNSNHTLQIISLPNSVGDNKRITEEIKSALIVNRNTVYPVRKNKVVGTMLDRERRLELSHLQGVENSSDHSLFSDIDPTLLPEVLAMMTGHRSLGSPPIPINFRSELYRMMVVVAPDLVSLIDRKALLKKTMKRNVTRRAAIAAELAALNDSYSVMERQLMSIEGNGKKNGAASGRKRGRDA